MQNKIIMTITAAILGVAIISDSALARPYYYHHGPRARLSFYYGYPPAYGAYAYPYYYRPYPVYYTAPPVIYTHPVVVETAPVYVQEGQQVSGQDGRYCREYTDNIQVGGRAGSSYGTACQQPDGSWEIQ